MKKWKSKLGYLRSWIIYEANPMKRKRLIRFYSSIISPGDLCFDIGAHTGIHSAIWNKIGARVVTVEPNQLFYHKLIRRFKHINQLEIIDRAISDQISTSTMYVSRFAPTVSTLADEKWQSEIRARSSFSVMWDKAVKVQTTTLDNLINTYGVPYFIKLDIENFEPQALRGLHQRVPWISFEFFSYLPDHALQCLQEINRLGEYHYNYSLGERFHWESDNWLTATQMNEWIKSRDPEAPNGDIYARSEKITV